MPLLPFVGCQDGSILEKTKESLLDRGLCERTRWLQRAHLSISGDREDRAWSGTPKEDEHLRSELKSSTKMISWINLAGVRFRTLERRWEQNSGVSLSYTSL